MNHAMLDCETLSLRKNAMLLSVGVVAFNVSSDGFDKWSWSLDLLEQRRLGRDIDPGTVCWWMAQDPKACALAFNPGVRVPLGTFTEELKQFLIRNDIGAVWCKGPAADGAWIESLCEDANLPCPVGYRMWRDVRTQCDGHEDFVDASDLVAHDPISDCLYQIRQVRKTWL